MRMIEGKKRQMINVQWDSSVQDILPTRSIYPSCSHPFAYPMPWLPRRTIEPRDLDFGDRMIQPERGLAKRSRLGRLIGATIYHIHVNTGAESGTCGGDGVEISSLP